MHCSFFDVLNDKTSLTYYFNQYLEVIHGITNADTPFLFLQTLQIKAKRSVKIEKNDIWYLVNDEMQLIGGLVR